MKGDFVILRTFEGPRVRRVLELADDVVWIVTDDEFYKEINGVPSLEPVGFPYRDVFQYDPGLEKEIASGQVNWSRLKPYKEKSEDRKAA